MNELLKVALLAYVGEPCAVCHTDIEPSDLIELRDVVFSGYRTIDGRVSRTAHGKCWRELSEEQRVSLRESAE